MVLIVVIVAFVVLITIDFVWWERPKNLRVDNGPDTGGQVTAQVELKSLIYDLPSHSFKATTTLYLKAVDDRNIDNVAFSLVDAGSREWLAVEKKRTADAAVQAGDCQLQLSEELDKNRPVSSASLECKDTVLATSSGTEEIWYPFDSYPLQIAPAICINSSDGACGQSSKAQTVLICSVGVVIADQNLIGRLQKGSRPDSYVLILKRRVFVRIVSSVFLFLSLVFLFYLAVAGDPNDLLPKSLGFFGTLWGLRALIAPSAVTIFPTVVDFSILTIFCILFILVLGKLLSSYWKHRLGG